MNGDDLVAPSTPVDIVERYSPLRKHAPNGSEFHIVHRVAFVELLDEIVRLRDELANMYRLYRERRALVDEVLAAWDADDEQERNDLDDRLWRAINAIRRGTK